MNLELIKLGDTTEKLPNFCKMNFEQYTLYTSAFYLPLYFVCCSLVFHPRDGFLF